MPVGRCNKKPRLFYVVFCIETCNWQYVYMFVFRGPDVTCMFEISSITGCCDRNNIEISFQRYYFKKERSL